MDHLERTAAEFARQADRFATAAAVTGEDLTRRFVEAVDADARARILDLASGPGIVTAAIAPDAGAVVAFDLTAEMLAKARARCATAGAGNVACVQGDAARLPFAGGAFDTVVTRLSVHHFEDPPRIFAEIHRVLRPGGRLVLADIYSSDDSERSALHNAVETLRDPSHVRMLPLAGLEALISGAGFAIERCTLWDQPRELEEWLAIVGDPARAGPVRTVMTTLARAGLDAGTSLAAEGEKVVFTHRWALFSAVRD